MRVLEVQVHNSDQQSPESTNRGTLPSVPAGVWFMPSDFSLSHRNGRRSTPDPGEQEALQPGLLLAEDCVRGLYSQHTREQCLLRLWRGDMEPGPCDVSVYPPCRSPSTPRFLFSESRARKGPHWLPGGPTLPSWWGHCGDPLEGQSHLQNHQTVPPALRGLRAADTGHLCPRSVSLALGTREQSAQALSSAFLGWPPNPHLSGPGKQDLSESAHEGAHPFLVLLYS